MKTPKTQVGAYANRPHKTIEQLVAEASARAADGELGSVVVQDLVDGYNLGWASENFRLVEAAVKSGGQP